MAHRRRAVSIASFTGGSGFLVSAFGVAGALMSQGSVTRGAFLAVCFAGAGLIGTAAATWGTDRLRRRVRHSIAPGPEKSW